MATITKQGQKGKLTKLDLDYEGTKDGENQVKNYLEIVQQKLGFIPNVLAAFAKFPKQFEGFTKLYNALMLGESGLTKLEREMIAVTVSSNNPSVHFFRDISKRRDFTDCINIFFFSGHKSAPVV